MKYHYHYLSPQRVVNIRQFLRNLATMQSDIKRLSLKNDNYQTADISFHGFYLLKQKYFHKLDNLKSEVIDFT